MTAPGGPADTAGASAASGTPAIPNTPAISTTVEPRPPRSERWRWALAPAFAAIVALALGMWWQRDVGIARDEVVYMDAGDRYATWWGRLMSGERVWTEAEITRAWGGPRITDNNREHPPLIKTWLGVSHRAAQALGARGHDEILAYRMPGLLMFALLCALVLVWARALWGSLAGWVAVAALLGMPRFLTYASVACFDVPIAALWFATLYAFARAVREPRWNLALWLAMGLALATKHNALMLPPILGVCALALGWVRRRGPQDVATGGGQAERVADVRPSAEPDKPTSSRRRRSWVVGAVWSLRWSWLALALSPLVLIAVWPWLWFDTVDHLVDWIRFHLTHVHYNYEYLGTNWNHPPFPWHVPVVTTLLTVPLPVLAAAAVGLAATARAVWRYVRTPQAVHVEQGSPAAQERVIRREHELVLWLGSGCALVPFLLGSTPIFGAEKHWLAAIVGVAMLAGKGTAALVRGLLPSQVSEAKLLGAVAATPPQLPRLAQAVGAGVMLSGLVALVVELAVARPYALSHYNAIAGGAPGGATLGMNRQYWGVAAHGTLPLWQQLAAEAPLDAQALPRQPAEGVPRVAEVSRAVPGQAAPLAVYTHDAAPAFAMWRRLGIVPTVRDAGPEGPGIAASQFALVIHERHFLRHDAMIWQRYGTASPRWVLTQQGVPVMSVYRRPLVGSP